LAVKIVAQNRKARHDYHILDTWEAGIVLQGTEVKSLREGRVSMSDSYARIKGGELILYNLHIGEYSKGTYANHDPLRPRKLLLHKRELRKLSGSVEEKGLTLIPLKIYFNERGLAKVQIGLARGKKMYDKRRDIAERDVKRDIERNLRKR